MGAHYLSDPDFCTVASSGEKASLRRMYRTAGDASG
jgi:hypothetical protein